MKLIPLKIKDSEEMPKCSNCKKEIDQLKQYQVGNLLMYTFLWACPECNHTLGVGPYQ